ncbi:MAG: hypothetical protein IPN01_12925 [Deltaproteobacteria bacterium]|nr:hypothetical protein [Deltaproteobacteria bacterium]
MGDSWNRMGSGATTTDNVGLFCAFAADLFGSLRDFLDMLATICGTLSALCYVVGGLLIIFGLALVWLAGIGAPLITAGGWLCRAGNLLGRVNNILAAVVRALSVLTTIFRTAAAFMVPTDQYAAQLQLLGADASTFGDKAGAKAADSTAGNLNNRLRAGTERRVNDGIANRSPQGQAGADQATRVQQLQDADAQRLASEAEAERQRQAQNQPPPAQDPANPNAHPPNGQNPQNGPNQDPNNPNRQPNDQDPNDPSRRRPGDVDTEPPRRSLFRRIVGKLPIINTAVTEFEHVARDVQDMFQNPARVGREQLSPEAWRQIEARVNGKAEQLGNRLRDLNADLDRARNEPQQDAEQIANIQREISSTERKLARVRSSLQEAQRAIPAAEAHQNALNRESADQEADPNGPTGRQRELERTRRQVRDLQNERRRVEGELQSANERLQAAQAAESEAQQRAADAERAHDDHVNSDEYRQREQAHRQEHARQQQQRVHEMDRLNTEAADLERRATHAEQAAPLRQTAQQQRAQADEAKQRAQRALTDMKAFENTRIKLTSDNGGADGMTNRRLISVDGDTVTVTNGRGQTETFPISAIVGPKSLRQAAGRVTRENAEAARLTTEAEAATTRADGLAPEGTDPQALRTQASGLRDQSLTTLAQHDQNLNPGELPDAQRDQLRTARTQATGAHSSASGQTQSLQTNVNNLQGENTRLNSELTQAQRNLQEQEALDRRMPGIQQNADLNRGSSGNATGGVGSAYKGVGEGLTRSLGIVEGLFGLLSTATQHSAYMQSKITRDANGKITEDKRTIGTAAEGATQGMRNTVLDATLGVMGHEHAMTDQRETPEQLLTFGQQQAERERNRAATIQALLACTPPITNIEQMNTKRTAALAAYDQYNIAWGDARKAFEAEQIVTQLSAQTLSMAQQGQPLQQSSQAMSAPLNQSVADEQSRQGVLSGLSSQAMQQPEGGIAGIVTGLIAKLAEHADRMDDQPNPPTADSGEQIQQGPTRANEEKTQRAEQANTASQEQRAFLDQAIAARATQEQHVTTSITTLEQKHQEEQAILAEIKNQKAAAIVRQEQHRAVVEENASGFLNEYNQMEAWRADYQAKRAAVETMQ